MPNPRHCFRISCILPRATGATAYTHRIPVSPHCRYFAIDELRLYDSISLSTKKCSFQLLFVLKGTVHIEYPEDVTVVQRGAFCCIPAYLTHYKLKTETEASELLRVTLPEKLGSKA